MLERWNVTVPVLPGAQPRSAYVYLPQAALEDPDARFPVLYMFDGHNLFSDEEATYGKSWGLSDYLDAQDIPLIVAAVECHHGPRNERLVEYCPFSAELPGFGYVKGKGHATMEWFIHQFKPYVDRHYPTLPDRKHTFIGGSSMGGLMSLYAVTAYNRLFSRAAALSPSLWFAPEEAQQMLAAHRLGRDTVVYLDYGEREMAQRREMQMAFFRCAELLSQKGARVTARIVPNGEHNEASWERQLPFFLNTLLYDLE